MSYFVVVAAGMAAYFTGSDLLSTASPTVAQYVVFGVCAGMTAVGLIVGAISGEDE